MTVFFTVLAIFSFLYYAVSALIFTPRSSVLYFYLLLGAYFLAIAHTGFFGKILLAPLLLFILAFSLFLLFAGKKPPEPKGRPSVFLLLGARRDGTQPKGVWEDRLLLAAKLLREEPDAVCILSGGKVFGETESEAAYFYRRLREEGIDPRRLIRESQSRTTRENFLFSFSLLPDENALCGVITSRFHVFRAGLIARTVKPDAKLCFYGAKDPLFFRFHLYLREFITFSVDLVKGRLSLFTK